MRHLLTALVALAAITTAASCAPVRFNQKQRLGETLMKIDPDPLRSEVDGKVLSSREGAIGGFHGSGVGGCGCN